MRWPVIVFSVALVTACGAPAEVDAGRCGWDLSTPAGVEANQERLTFVTSFLLDNPGQTPPPINSPYWFGDCPIASDAPTSGPDHEDESPHDDEGFDHLDPDADPAQH